MLPLRFTRRCAMKMFLWLSLLSSPVFTYPLVLSITANKEHIILGLMEYSYSFEYCVCHSSYNSCQMPYAKLDPYIDTQSEALSAENAANHGKDKVFQCQYFQYSAYFYTVSCTRNKASICSSNPCTLNIIIACSDDKNVVLTWSSTQQPLVLGVPTLPVIDCFKTSTSTTEVTTTSTPPSTTFTTTTPTSHPTTTTSPASIISSGISQSTTSTPDATTINNTYWETTNQQMGTTDIQSRNSKQQNGTRGDSTQVSSQYIGLIVGTTVAAILVTIVIMCVCWRLKTRMEKNRRNHTAEGAVSVSGNPEGAHSDVSRHPANEADKKASKSIALVSPLVQSGARENHLTQAAGDYTYIDVNSTASRKSNSALTTPSHSVKENHHHSTVASAITEIQDGEYSHLGTNKVRQEIPYNCDDQQNRSTTIQPVIIPAVPLTQQQLNHCLQPPNSYLRPTDHHVSQPTGACENSRLYSTLLKSKIVHENAYNSLHNLNEDPVTEPSFSQNSGKRNATPEIRSETTATLNHKLQLFPRASKHKSMDIVDVVPYTYTEVTPRTTREKSNDSNHSKERNDQAVVTPSKSDHLMTQATKYSEPTSKINMAKETVKDINENNTNEEKMPAYVNAVFSMHEIHEERNTSFSLEETAYANLH